MAICEDIHSSSLQCSRYVNALPDSDDAAAVLTVSIPSLLSPRTVQLGRVAVRRPATFTCMSVAGTAAVHTVSKLPMSLHDC